MQLWEFDVRHYNHDGIKLLTLSHRAQRPVLYNSLHYQQIDPSHGLKNRNTTIRARALIRSLGFKFPVPAPPQLVFPTLTLYAHPQHDAWLKFFSEDSYPPDSYHHDSKLFWSNYLRIKTHLELWQRTAKKLGYIRRTPSRRHAAKSALGYLPYFKHELEQLNQFYGEKPIPPQVHEMLREMESYKKYLVPSKK